MHKTLRSLKYLVSIIIMIINTSYSYCYTLLERDNLILDFKFGLGSLNVEMISIPDSIRGDMSFGSGEALMSASIAKEVEVLKYKLEWEYVGRYEGGRGMPSIIKDSVLENTSSCVQLIFKPSVAVIDNQNFFYDIGPTIHYISNKQRLTALNRSTSIVTEYIDYNINKWGAGLNSCANVSYPLINKPVHTVSLFMSGNYDLIFSYKPINKVFLNFGVREEGARKGLKLKCYEFYLFYNQMTSNDFRYKLVGIGANIFF